MQDDVRAFSKKNRTSKKRQKAATAISNVPVSRAHPYGLYLTRHTLYAVLFSSLLSAIGYVLGFKVLLWTAIVGISSIFFALVYSNRNLRAIEVKRLSPDTAAMGEAISLRYIIRNNKNQPALAVKLVELVDQDTVLDIPRCYVPLLGKKDHIVATVQLIPLKRGKLKFYGTRLGTSFPFGILNRFYTIDNETSITVYPALGKLTNNFIVSRRNVDFFAGTTVANTRGSSDEFYALREYRWGDNPKLIHWKRSARMRKLLVREMTNFSPMRLTVILNTYLPPRFSEIEFEEAVSFAATLLCTGLESQYRVSLICATQPTKVIPPISGREAQHRVLSLLSELAPNYERDLLTESIGRMNFTRYWWGHCIVISFTPPAAAVINKLTQSIGETVVFTPDHNNWRNIFIPPRILVESNDS